MRWIRTQRRIYIHVQMAGWINSGRIAIPVVIVVVALRREIFPSRRLCELPQIRKIQPTLRWLRRRNCAARRWRTRVIGDPKSDVSSARILANVFCRNHTCLPFFRRNPGAIDPGPESGGTDRIHPRVNVGLLLRQHATAFFDIQKNNRICRKALTPRRAGRRLAIQLPNAGSIMFQLFVKTSVEQHEKSESC